MKISKLLILLTITFYACLPNEKREVLIDFSDTDKVNTKSDVGLRSHMYIAVASMVSPKETFRYYNELIQFVAKRLKSTAFLKQKKLIRK